MKKDRDHNVDAAVGRKIRSIRIEKNLSLQDLASHLGITYQQVQKYETGSNRISAGKLVATASFLGVPVTSFFEETNLVLPEDKALPRFLRHWEKLTQEQKKVFIQLAKECEKLNRLH